jgi:hemerythrin-like domain-containing protein
MSSAATQVASGDRPLDNFSQCHAGIVQHLHALGELPALLEPAARARRVAADTLDFFRKAVYEHHAEEERELFPAVLASAAKGEERDRVQVMVDQLTAEHRRVEAAWESLEPGLRDVAKGHDTRLDPQALERLVALYLGHAAFEEREFLPLSEQILGRNGNHMAALGMSLHMRHAMPDALRRYGHRI